MKFVFCLLAERGHINPYIGPAQALQALGHEVLMAPQGDFSEQMKKSALPYTDVLHSEEAANAPRGKALVDLMENPDVHLAVIEEVFIKAVPYLVHPIQEFLKKEKPDAVIVDPMNYAAVIAADLLKIPWISISSSLTSVLPTDLRSYTLGLVDILAPKREAIFRSFGSFPQFHAIDCLSPYLNITFATKDFVGVPPTKVELVGPSLPLSQRGDEVQHTSVKQDRPLVYVSFGSQIFYYPEVFKKIVAAAKNLPVRLAISVGDLIHESEFQSTEDVEFYQYAPQLEILKQASLFITHGGANSVMEGIRANVPLLISPICNDQFHQAYFVEKSGVGRSLDLRTASMEEIRHTMEGLLSDQDIKTSMKKVSETYQDNGSLKAAELIQNVVQKVQNQTVNL